MAEHFLNGMAWELEHGATTMLRISAEGEVCGKLIPYQLRMLQEQAMNRLLPLAAEEADGRIVLHYDLTGNRRLVQRLYADPPSFRQYVELAHRLARIVAESQQWMLHESGFVLHEDFVYAGRKRGDFQLCYLPLEGATEGRLMPPVTHQLRQLLLRLLAFVKDGVPQEMAPVFALLSQEPYAIVQLEQALRKLRYGGMGSARVGEAARDKSAGRGFASAGNKGGVIALLDKWREKVKMPGKLSATADYSRMSSVRTEADGSETEWRESSRSELNRKESKRRNSSRSNASWHQSILNKTSQHIGKRSEGNLGDSRRSEGNRSQGNLGDSRRSEGGFGEEKTGLLGGGAGGERRDIRFVFNGENGIETREMDTDRFLIGRKQDSVHYALTSEGVSRIHCEFVRQADGLTVADLGSLNGTMLNGDAMLPYKHYPFRQGDVLQVAGTAIRLEPAMAFAGADQAAVVLRD